MAITNGYATRNQIKAALRIGTADTQDDELIDNCAGAASRLIDGYANRQFWAYGSAIVRVFTAGDEYVCEIDDIGSTAITLKTSTLADGVFDVTWTHSPIHTHPCSRRLSVSDIERKLRIGSIGATHSHLRLAIST
ncbi:MAG: phage gp6-like head-tail connector protein [Micrococcales bacterium]|nr:phage gp6-like head-tail connector protein [Micrococcales bacterium]